MINKTIYGLSLRKRTNRVVVNNCFARYYYEKLDIEEDPDLDPVDHEMLKKEIDLDGFAYCYSLF